MGGFGLGRPSGSGRGTVETYRLIDVNWLHRECCLQPGWCGSWEVETEATPRRCVQVPGRACAQAAKGISAKESAIC